MAEDQKKAGVYINHKSPWGGILRLLAAILLLSAIVAFVYYYFPTIKSFLKPFLNLTQPSPSPAAVSSPSPQPPNFYAAVQITPSGFIPATIQVKPNTRITWTNTDQKFHKIASDPHPSHTTFPALNSPRLKSNDVFPATFTKPGTYTYHDEANPLKANGTIIVSE